MSVNVYLPQDDKRPEQYGFRWCTKDCRYESKSRLTKAQVLDLADHFGAKVELLDGRMAFTATPAVRVVTILERDDK